MYQKEFFSHLKRFGRAGKSAAVHCCSAYRLEKMLKSALRLISADFLPLARLLQPPRPEQNSCQGPLSAQSTRARPRSAHKTRARAPLRAQPTHARALLRAQNLCQGPLRAQPTRAGQAIFGVYAKMCSGPEEKRLLGHKKTLRMTKKRDGNFRAFLHYFIKSRKSLKFQWFTATT